MPLLSNTNKMYGSKQEIEHDTEKEKNENKRTKRNIKEKKEKAMKTVKMEEEKKLEKKEDNNKTYSVTGTVFM
jgi:hypothetical protein